MYNIKKCLHKQKEVLESMGYKVSYIAVYGSQNYKLDLYTDDYQSDLDMKAVVFPTLRDLIENSKPVSKRLRLNGESVILKILEAMSSNLQKATQLTWKPFSLHII